MIKHRVLLSNLALLGVLLLGAAYLLIEIVQVNPATRPIALTVNLPASGGLLDRSEVTYRGQRVGKLTDIRLRPGGVAVDVQLAEGTEIPVDTDVIVAGLSAVGEQYLDFRPRVSGGPYLATGAVLDDRSRTTMPTPFPDFVSNLNNAAQQADPAKLRTIVNELMAGYDGAAPDTKQILDDGDYLLTGLESILPQTVRLIGNARTLFNLAESQSGNGALIVTGADKLVGVVAKADPVLRKLLDEGPEAVALGQDLLAKNGGRIQQVIKDVGPLSSTLGSHVSALSALFPSLTGAAEALPYLVSEGGLQAIADIYPRPSCDYNTPRRPPTEGGFPPPFVNRYCTEQGPILQQRGSQNAPRPPGDDTARPAPGANPLELARPPRTGDGHVATSNWYYQYAALIGGTISER